MLTQTDLVASIGAYEKEIQEALRIAKTLTLPEPITLSFRLSNLTVTEIERLAAALPSGHRKEDKDAEYIYVFTLADSSADLLEEMLSAFDEAREFQDTDEYDGKKNLCKPNAISEATRAIYVGRSYRPRDRLKQHLSESSSGTYAIHFAMWASELKVDVKFSLYRFAGLGNRVIQVLEDGLWDNLQPLLGKRGEK
ncbi:hypothetical protein [Undibacterium fentianense]|uniref:GIY-YIG domain-containing protein n=1 Tax=Undibacterium fentianense TaxID=2828728 RepID=A0A941E0H1_9BURK|nr:hypothetical protein [Undibacterium fentianense]MBR7800105.1 hypothetical protein [Undibacterium fentianense]